MKKLLVLITVFLLQLTSSFISAHPMPLAIQEFNLVFSNEKVLIDYRLRIEPLTVDRFYPVLDKDNSGTLSDSEIDTFSTELLKNNVYGRFNNKDIVFKKLSHKTVDKDKILSFDNYIEINYEIEKPKILDTNSFFIKNTKKFVEDDPYGDLNSIITNVEDNPNAQVLYTAQDTYDDRFEYSIDYKLKDYQNTPGTIQETKNESNVSAPNQTKNETNNSFLTWTSDTSKSLTSKIFSNENHSQWFYLFALLLAFIAGALHAITPGHGKSMMAAFLIGKKKSKFKDVLILGAAITVSHTIIIYILGFVLLYLKQTDRINVILPYFEKASGLLLAILGSSLLYKSWKNYQHYKLHKEHVHHENEDLHDHTWKKKGKISGSWDLFVAGLGGGIVPCIDALSLLVLSVSLGQVGFGLIVILAFSIGLAAAIVTIGVLLVQGKNKLNLDEKYGAKVEIVSPLITGLFIFVYVFLFLF